MTMQSRPDLLSPHEQKLVDAHRDAIRVAQVKTSSMTPDIKQELSSIYEDLVYTAPELLPERLPEITERIYRLLY